MPLLCCFSLRTIYKNSSFLCNFFFFSRTASFTHLTFHSASQQTLHLLSLYFLTNFFSFLFYNWYSFLLFSNTFLYALLFSSIAALLQLSKMHFPFFYPYKLCPTSSPATVVTTALNSLNIHLSCL